MKTKRKQRTDEDYYNESRRLRSEAMLLADELCRNPLRFTITNGITMDVEITKSDLKTIVSKNTQDKKRNTKGGVKKLYDWTKDRMADCADDNSEANELMLKRVAYHAINYSAPFIDARHWSSMHQKGSYWTGDYETDETDWKLCELIARIQYATQQHFFGVMAEKYFDDMNSDVQITGKRHQQRSVDGYNRLPDVFTAEDVIRCFNYDKPDSARKKLNRLTLSHQIELIESGEQKGCYRKVAKLIL